MMRSLADILAPADEAYFLRQFSKKERFLLHADTPGRAETLLPWLAIDRLFSGSVPPREKFRVVLNPNSVEPWLYRNRDNGAIRLDALLGLASQGATFVISGIQEYVPAIDALTVSIERRIGCPVWANCYVSFGKFSGFPIHCDAHDVLILQVWGSKRWCSYGTPVPHPIDGMRLPKPGAPIWEGVLRSGDVLYVPRGEFHDAVPEESPSVHLTIGFAPSRGTNFTQWQGERAGENVLLRADLERARDPNAPIPNEAAIKQALHALIDKTTIGEYLAAEDRKRPIRRVAAFAASRRLTEQTTLVSALRRRLDLETMVEDELEIEIGGNLVRLSAMGRRALHAITEHDRMTLADLAAELKRHPEDRELRDGLGELTRKALIAIDD